MKKLDLGGIVALTLLVIGLFSTWYAYGDAAIAGDTRSLKNENKIRALYTQGEIDNLEHQVIYRALLQQQAYLKAIAEELDVKVVIPDDGLIALGMSFSEAEDSE